MILYSKQNAGRVKCSEEFGKRLLASGEFVSSRAMPEEVVVLEDSDPINTPANFRTKINSKRKKTLLALALYAADGDIDVLNYMLLNSKEVRDMGIGATSIASEVLDGYTDAKGNPVDLREELMDLVGKPIPKGLESLRGKLEAAAESAYEEV